jgi:hypothetical protein
MDIIPGSHSFHKLAGTHEAWYGLKGDRFAFRKAKIAGLLLWDWYITTSADPWKTHEIFIAMGHGFNEFIWVFTRSA